MTPAVLAGTLAGAAGALLVVDGAAPLRRVDGLTGSTPSRRSPDGVSRVARWQVTVLLAGVPLALTRSLLLAVATTVAARTVQRAVADRQRRRAADAGAETVAELLSAFAAELRGGGRPVEALADAAAAGDSWVAAALARPGPDPPAALETLGRRPGAQVLADLAVAWRVVDATGAALADVAARAAESARSELAARRMVAAELAAARATSVLLAALPAAGVLLGTGLGADPLGFLVGSTAGRVCLLAGVLLMAAGTVWTDAVARRAEQP